MRSIFLAVFTATLFSSFINNFYAAPVIKITSGQVRPEPISLLQTQGSYGQELDTLIEENLNSTGNFEMMDKKGFIQSSSDILTTGMRYGDWRVTKTRFVYVAKSETQSGQLSVTLQLYDVICGKKMIEITLKGEARKWRRMAHMISDLIYHQVTGEDGFFNTRLAFVEPTNAKGRNQNTCLKIMDSDGFKESIVQYTDGKNLVLTPRYSPDGKTLAYLIFNKNKGEVYTIDLNTKTSRHLGNYEGLSFAPRFSPDGRKIVFSIAKSGATALFEQDLYYKSLKQLTPYNRIDTSPGYSPDGKKIVFVSDRAGRPALYSMNADGTDIQRITTGVGTYTQPCWSPRGDYIAFTLQKDRTFYIGIIRPDGTGERLIATGYLVEDPIWTSNGRFLIFTVQDRNAAPQRIVRMDLTGRHQYIYKTPKEAFGPSLSPLLGSAIAK